MHLFGQGSHEFRGFAFQEVDDLGDHPVVRRFALQPLARSLAFVYVVVETDLEFFSPDLFIVEFQPATADLENRTEQVDNRAQLPRFGIGAEIGRAVMTHLSGEKYSRERLVRDDKIRIGLVVLEVDVVSGFEILYEIVFEDERFDFRGSDDHFDIGYMADQDFCLAEEPVRVAKIGAHSRTQVFRLADIDDLAVPVFELIDAR